MKKGEVQGLRDKVEALDVEVKTLKETIDGKNSTIAEQKAALNGEAGFLMSEAVRRLRMSKFKKDGELAEKLAAAFR